MTRIAIVGGGPAGYEAALVAAQLGATVTLIDSDGVGGSCVLTDCVPSKTLIATSDRVTAVRDAARVGIDAGVAAPKLAEINTRIKELAASQSRDIADRLRREGVTILVGRGRFAPEQPPRAHRIEIDGGSTAAVTVTSSRPTSCCSPPVARPGCWTRPARTASGS